MKYTGTGRCQDDLNVQGWPLRQGSAVCQQRRSISSEPPAGVSNASWPATESSSRGDRPPPWAASWPGEPMPCAAARGESPGDSPQPPSPSRCVPRMTDLSRVITPGQPGGPTVDNFHQISCKFNGKWAGI